MGLLGGIARTAVVAGTASAVGGRVRHRQDQKWARQDAQAADPEPGNQAPEQASAPPAKDRLQQLKELGDLEGLQKLPKNSSPTRWKNRDFLHGRPRGYMRRFGLNRINFREKASKGEIPGITKSSW